VRLSRAPGEEVTLGPMDNPRVLIIDDELGVRESLRMILKDRGEAVCASSGEEGLS